ncbi:hypothetical protein DRJ19_04650, partial [Candidatus Woesearchaeota archaeon]
ARSETRDAPLAPWPAAYPPRACPGTRIEAWQAEPGPLRGAPPGDSGLRDVRWMLALWNIPLPSSATESRGGPPHHGHHYGHHGHPWEPPPQCGFRVTQWLATHEGLKALRLSG